MHASKRNELLLLIQQSADGLVQAKALGTEKRSRWEALAAGFRSSKRSELLLLIQRSADDVADEPECEEDSTPAEDEGAQRQLESEAKAPGEHAPTRNESPESILRSPEDAMPGAARAKGAKKQSEPEVERMASLNRGEMLILIQRSADEAPVPEPPAPAPDPPPTEEDLTKIQIESLEAKIATLETRLRTQADDLETRLRAQADELEVLREDQKVQAAAATALATTVSTTLAAPATELAALTEISVTKAPAELTALTGLAAQSAGLGVGGSDPKVDANEAQNLTPQDMSLKLPNAAATNIDAISSILTPLPLAAAADVMSCLKIVEQAPRKMASFGSLSN